MKAVLIRAGGDSRSGETNITGCYPPLGLAYVAASLREAGHEPVVLDAEAMGWGSAEAAARIPADAGWIGFTSTTTAWPVVREAAAEVRRRFPDTPMIVGGPQVTAFPEETLAASVFDAGVMGDGERTAVAICERLAAGRDLAGLPGCVARSNGSIRAALPIPWVEDLDSLPLPALDLLPMDRYRSVLVDEPFVTMIASRGCPYRCDFCSQIYDGDALRPRSPEAVVDEMARAVDRFGAREIVLFDETFGARRKAALRVCELIRERGLRVRWNARTRIDLVDRELLAAMRAAGCHTLHLGIESGTDRVLKLMNKRITTAQVRDAVRLARDLGFRTHGYFMIGYPGETRAEIDATLRFSRGLGLDWASYTITLPHPRTPLGDRALRDGVLRPDYWTDHIHGRRPADELYFVSAECPAAHLKKAKRAAYLRFYLRPGILARAIAFFLRRGGLRRAAYAFRLWLREELR